MGFELAIFGGNELDADYLDWLVDEQSPTIHRHFSRLWDYYANPRCEVVAGGASERKVSESGRCYVQAQEYGLPSRITGLAHGPQGDVFDSRAVKDVQRKEVVVENDIAWRVNAAADFLFGRPVNVISKAPDGRKRSNIEAIIKALFAANGGLGFFQDMAVLGSVYGFVDCFIRPDPGITERIVSRPSTQRPSLEAVLHFAQAIDLELIEAPRALPVLDEDDYRIVRFYVQHFHQKKNAVTRKNSFLARLLARTGQTSDTRQVVAVTEITSPEHWQRYEDKVLVAEGETPWGFLPVVHIQNIAQPYYYEGTSDVEPLIPLQDELNTRLSDRACRVTFQSFKMYLGRGIDNFENRPVAPGRMWSTDNPDASIEEFGGDAASPSEEAHVSELREALDKTSGITPLAAGLLRDRLGNLTSAAALKVALMGTLARLERKRVTYGEGLVRLNRMVLALLDRTGIFPNEPDERATRLHWASPLPESQRDQLEEARLKLDIGVGRATVLRELGYEVSEEH